MKNLCFILMLLIITASACKKDKSQPKAVTPTKPDSTNVKPNDTPEAKIVATNFTGELRYVVNCREPQDFQNKDTIYQDTYVVVNRDSLVSFYRGDTTYYVTGHHFKKNPNNKYNDGDGRYWFHTYTLKGDSLFVETITQNYYCSYSTYFRGKK